MQTDSSHSLPLPEGPKRPGVIRRVLRPGRARGKCSDCGHQRRAQTRRPIFWIGLFEPDERLLREIQEEFGLHDLAIEDAHDAHQRPKLERYGNFLFVVLRTAHLVNESQHVEFGETHVFAGPRFVVSVWHGSLRSHYRIESTSRTRWCQ